MADTEEYFPRGGKKPSIKKFKQSNNFLGAPERTEKKKSKPKKKSEADDGYLSDEAHKEVDESYKNCAAGLSYATIKPGVLILGRVHRVSDTKVTMMLPSKMMGQVMACHVSQAYNKLLEAYVNDQIEKITDLSEMFRPGQYVATKVLEADGDQLTLSVMPEHVNGGKTQGDLHNGCLLQAAVSSVEDHGYVMDIGIPNTTAFLPKKAANPEIELETGTLTWCVIKSVDNSVVKLSSRVDAIQSGVLKRSHNKLNNILPGTAVDFTVDKPLENGIEGHVFKNITAYVQRQHADNVKGKKPTLGQTVRCRVLYVMPTRNAPFLTMKGIFDSSYPDLQAEQKFKEGDIIEEAQVLKITGRSIHLRLGPGSVGTLSVRRIQVDENLSDEQIVAKSYPIGSTHKVRILTYNLSDYLYSVTDQPSIVNEKYFNLSALTVGQLVSATVTAVSDNSVALTVGRIKGMVPHAHISDAGIFIDPKKVTTTKLHKKKYKVGQEVKARVLSLDLQKQTLFLTLKPSLLAADIEVLSSYHQAQVGKSYTGVIRHIREDYLLVTFFNNVTAYVPRKFVTKDEDVKLFDAFHIGQLVTCTILYVDVEGEKMTGSLITSPFTHKTKREKRKIKEDTEETPPKKKKNKNKEEINTTEKEEISKKDKKKKKLQKNSDDESGIEKHDEESETENKKDRKRKRDKQNEVSEESDAIETDLPDDSDQALTPQDLGLIDFSDCQTAKEYKHRIVSLLRIIKNRTIYLDKVDKKIENIEERGLTAKNKKFHTAMHKDKLVTEQRIKRLIEALTEAQNKLKEFDEDDDKKDYKIKKEKKEKTEEVKDIKETKTKEVKKMKEVKVVDSLEPVLEVPSVKSFWTATPEELGIAEKKQHDEDSSSSEEEEKDQPKKKRKKLTVAEKLAKVREEEERVREMERRAIESEQQPRTVEQFERALLANPNCSQLWIAYMATHLQSTEIDKARAVARKALNTINFREELERLNVWLAMINCEHRFGTKESQQKILEEALQMNEPYKIHSKLLDILVETGKHQELSSLVDLMMKKYKREVNCYIACGTACFKLGLVDKARQVMQKAISVLEKKEHVSVLVQFALLERGSGAAERAEALFEQVLAVYPQRVDVVGVYADMLVKSGDAERVRQVMERMTSQKLPARKMKILYKKWIEVEEKLGDKEQVENIRQKAMEFIDKAKF